MCFLNLLGLLVSWAPVAPRSPGSCVSWVCCVSWASWLPCSLVSTGHHGSRVSLDSSESLKSILIGHLNHWHKCAGSLGRPAGLLSWGGPTVDLAELRFQSGGFRASLGGFLKPLKTLGPYGPRDPGSQSPRTPRIIQKIPVIIPSSLFKGIRLRLAPFLASEAQLPKTGPF